MRHTPSRPRRRPVLQQHLAFGAVAGLVLTLTTACGGNDPAASAEQRALPEGETLKITTFGEFGYDALIEEWNAEHPDVQVEQTKVSLWDDWKVELTTGLQAGTGLPDVVAVEGDFMPAVLAAPDRWVDLTDEELEGRWLDFKVEEATTSDGRQLGYASDAGPEAICYRADLLEQAGMPSDPESVAAMMGTWEDYFAAGEQFVEKSDAAWYDSSGSIAQAMLNQLEFPFETEDNEVDVENEGLAAVWEAVSTNAPTLSTGHAQWGDDWTAAFKRDGFATIPCPGWMRSNIKDNTGNADVRWDIADVFPGGGGNWGGSFLAVPKTSAYQTEAKELAAWLTAPEQQIRIFEQLGNFPSQVEAIEDEKLQSSTDPFFDDAPVGEIYTNRADAIEVTPYKGPLYSDILGKLQEAVTRVDQGAEPQESWETFTREVASLS